MTSSKLQNNKQLNKFFQQILKQGKYLQNRDVELHPTVGAYLMYDQRIYYTMTNDTLRNEIYQAAINQAVKDKVVVEIGTGEDIVLAKMCVAAGAKKIYAIEINHKSYNQAQKLIDQLGFRDKIFLIYGDATKVEIPELADVCVSELLGTIASSEGVNAIINNARRFLKPGGTMLPTRSITHIAAACLPEYILASPALSQTGWDYLRRIFQYIGYPFDLRICIKNLKRSDLISNINIFEDLDFNQPLAADYSQQISLTINKDSRLDGFVLWLKLYTSDSEVVDVFDDRNSNWMPVLFPVFYPSIAVNVGDRIEASCQTTLSDDGIYPDYKIFGNLIKTTGEKIAFKYESSHHKPVFRHNQFYQDLFAEDGVRIIYDYSPRNIWERIKFYLRDNLPAPIVNQIRKLRTIL